LGLLFFAVALAGQEAHNRNTPEKLGTVSFPISCRPSVQQEFNRGIALLHSFAYKPAESAFRAVGEKDAHCAMAHWGVAMAQFISFGTRPCRQRQWRLVKKKSSGHAQSWLVLSASVNSSRLWRSYMSRILKPHIAAGPYCTNGLFAVWPTSNRRTPKRTYSAHRSTLQRVAGGQITREAEAGRWKLVRLKFLKIRRVLANIGFKFLETAELTSPY
jgi:hypothetical protein